MHISATTHIQLHHQLRRHQEITFQHLSTLAVGLFLQSVEAWGSQPEVSMTN
jgi:hypothetical protein